MHPACTPTQGRLPGQPGGSGHAPVPADHPDRARQAFVTVVAGNRGGRCAQQLGCRFLGQMALAQIIPPDPACCIPAGTGEQAGFQGQQAQGMGLTGWANQDIRVGTPDARAAIEATGDICAQQRCSAAAHQPQPFGMGVRQARTGTQAIQRIQGQIPSARRRCGVHRQARVLTPAQGPGGIAARGRPAVRAADPNRAPSLMQCQRGDQPVAAVVPGPQATQCKRA